MTSFSKTSDVVNLRRFSIYKAGLIQVNQVKRKFGFSSLSQSRL